MHTEKLKSYLFSNGFQFEDSGQLYVRVETKRKSQAIFSLLKGPTGIIHLFKNKLKIHVSFILAKGRSTQYGYACDLMLIRNSSLTFTYHWRTKM